MIIARSAIKANVPIETVAGGGHRRSHWLRTAAVVAQSLGVASLSGCATVPAATESAPTTPPPPTKMLKSPIQPLPMAKHTDSIHGNRENEASGVVNLTPLTGTRDVESIESPAGGNYFDAYTRVLVHLSCAETFCSPDGTHTHPTKYSGVFGYNSRYWLVRLIWGQSISYSFTLGVTAGAFSTTMPLVTIDHRSDVKNGEQWSQAFYHNVDANPLFLISKSGQGATPSVKAELKANLQTESQAASQIVNAVLAVAKDVSPSGPVVTALSKPLIQQQAVAIDTALSALFGKSIDEQNMTDEDMAAWNFGKSIEITLSISKKYNHIESRQPMLVGRWILTFDAPRPSAFVDWRICTPKSDDSTSSVNLSAGKPLDPAGDLPSTNTTAKAVRPHTIDVDPSRIMNRCAGQREAARNAVYRDVDAAAVMNFTLTNDQNKLGQIQNYLSQQSWYKSDLTALSNSGGAGAPVGAGSAKNTTGTSDDAATDFCTNIRNTMGDLGLSSTDSNIVVWATYWAMAGINSQARKTLAHNRSCEISMIPVNDWRSSIDKLSGADLPPLN